MNDTTLKPWKRIGHQPQGRVSSHGVRKSELFDISSEYRSGLRAEHGFRQHRYAAVWTGQSAPVPSVPWKLPRRVALIVVDAHTDSDYGWDFIEHPLSRAKVLGSLGHVAVSNYSFETLELFREVMARLAREHAGSGDLEISTYIIDLHFNQLADESDRRFFNSVRTSLQLPAKTVDRLRELARGDLAENKEFRRLVADLKNQPGNITFVQRSAIDGQSEVVEPLRQRTHITTSLKDAH